ncbi:MAG: sigma-70 family RNA polymerase sigma factor [Verrucomicrobiae bacterium]|nr:sigma-70 family RNA polymerase sigma factor [Verrucomicrobiae bacterium]
MIEEPHEVGCGMGLEVADWQWETRPIWPDVPSSFCSTELAKFYPICPEAQAMEEKWQNLVDDHEDFQSLVGELYRELKKLAQAKLAFERPGMTLNATALVHEAWIRLEQSSPESWRDRSQFFASAAEAMRRILVEAARKRKAAKRGSGAPVLSLDGIELPLVDDSTRLMEVHEVLDELEAADAMKAQIVKLRFFCGLENGEIAALMGVNEKTVRRHWELAKLWLFRAIRDES